MGDGRLGKCKACTKQDTRDRAALKAATDLQWVLSERERHRKKAIKQRAEGRNAKFVTIEYNRLRNLRQQARHPEKHAARAQVRNAIRDGRLQRQPCEACGKKAQAHHDDYTKPLEVRWLCPRDHSDHHIALREKDIMAQFGQLV